MAIRAFLAQKVFSNWRALQPESNVSSQIVFYH
jgi:hypothetical protein